MFIITCHMVIVILTQTYKYYIRYIWSENAHYTHVDCIYNVLHQH